MFPTLMILSGLSGLYCSYLHYHDHLFPKTRGRHYVGTSVMQFPNVAKNLNYIRSGLWRA